MEKLHLLSFATTLGGGVLLWLIEGVVPFFSAQADRGRHAALNLSLAAVNLAILLPGSLLMAAFLEYSVRLWPGIRGFELPIVAQTLLILLLIDLWMYLWHRLNHTVDFFWRFHSVHHSDPALDVTSSWRFHSVEIFFSESLKLPVFALIGADIGDVLLYSMLMTPVIEFHHSNVSIPEALDRALRAVIPTPFMHRIHHSVLRSEHDSNYGSMLSVWDRLFGSYRMKTSIRNMPLGLENESAPDQQRLRALLLRPFRN
ncbi:sterol desaturase [Prosthecochloris sp. GSB1]|uniref:sterol desaturase family protein n=1 Tax=Prosthecochloris sp. GSB1 TaxID=281093 RepID=UPI000B8CE8EC|nr:sterol desaturase family protein [Prosthecochloris sp. GSB1]ASQ90308.1 sterol desaturase [Prosthecochloris sp. GSB1]